MTSPLARFTGFDISQGGSIKATVTSHPFVKDEDGLILPMAQVLKVGADMDVIEDTDAGPMFVWDHTSNSTVFSMMFQAQPFLQKPNQACRLTGITVS